MHRNQSVDVHRFAMVPRADIPRASFNVQRALKTTFDSGYLVPVLCEEVLPGDAFNVRMTAFARLATPIYPLMDNMYLDSFFFFVPNRLVWANWKKFMGEQANPADSISYVIPTITSKSSGYDITSLFDYFGLPTLGQVGAGNTFTHSALPFRAYNLIYNEWFRDENLVNSAFWNTNDGPDTYTSYTVQRRGKRHDYFTSCLPWPQKGGTAVTLPLGTSAPVWGTSGTSLLFGSSTGTIPTGGLPLHPTATVANTPILGGATAPVDTGNLQVAWKGNSAGVTTGLYADLSSATAATINQLRQSFQIQKLLERDARGGTRYTEIVRAHFGVVSPDARQQRPEYLGGGTTPVVINPIAQTSGTGASGTTSPQGNLAAYGTALSHGHGFSAAFTEHGYIIGLVNVRADLTYQQGLRRHWSRSTRYDFYFPAFAMLGEQAVLRQEIYCVGNANDQIVFGYQERWAEYRYSPSEITGLFRSTAAGTLDSWHLAQKFTSAPVLGQTFIEDFPPVSRVVAVPSQPQFIFDSFFTMRMARPMPLYSVPGLIDHF